MKKILLVSHGTIAKGVFDAVDMIFGTVEGLSFVCLEKGMPTVDFQKKFTDEIEQMKPFGKLIVLADLQGGSPYTFAAEYVNSQPWKADACVIAGLNLPLVFTAIESDSIDEIVAGGRDGIQPFTIQCGNDDDDL